MTIDKVGKVILVVGATGQQGSGVVRHLRANGWTVRALTRDLDKPQAAQLAAEGVEVVRGDLDNIASIVEALRGAYGLFSVQTWKGTPEGIHDQTRQGIALAEAVRNAGVQHVVHSSVDGAERGSGIPHFENQLPVEERWRELGLPVTILRPVFFMENFYMFFTRTLDQNLIAMDMRPDTKLQMIAVDDIGALAAVAFDQPESLIGQTLPIAGDELTLPQVAETLSQVLGRPIQYFDKPDLWLGDDFLSREFKVMFEWYNAHGYHANIARVRVLYPPLKTLKMWLQQTHFGQAGH